MNSKERVMTSLNWQEPDRVPCQIYTTPEIWQQLADYFKGQDVLQALGIDLRMVCPQWKGPVKPSRKDVDGADIFYDIWGAGYKLQQNPSQGTYAEAYELGLATIETMDDFDKYPWPDPDMYDYSTLEAQCEANGEYAVCVGDAGIPDIVNGVSRGRGMEQVLIDIATRDEVGLAVIQKRVDFYFEYCKRCLEACNGKVDILCLGEDTGNQNGRMVSPRDFDDVFRPAIEQYIDLGHEYGCKVMMHSCGDTHELQATFIDMELDALDAMQPEPKGMDPETIRAACYGKLAFCGLISTQQTLPHGTEEECRAEARHRLDVIAKGGGYIFAPAHCIQPDTPLRNVLAIYEEALGKKLM